MGCQRQIFKIFSENVSHSHFVAGGRVSFSLRILKICFHRVLTSRVAVERADASLIQEAFLCNFYLIYFFKLFFHPQNS